MSRTVISFTGLGTKEKAQRKLMVTAVDVSTTSTPEWEIIGAGIEASSIEFNPTITKITDILGVTETTVDKMEDQQSFDPFTLRQGSKLHGILYDIIRRRAWSELETFDVLVIDAYVTSIKTVDSSSVTVYNATKHTGCTIEPKSIGGSGKVDLPINIHYSGNTTLGTVDAYTGTITFTADT